jgi:hypothetical protein
VHVLTKIFVVLVSMLAVLLVPLVVVYAHNEESYQRKFDRAEAQLATAQTAKAAAEDSMITVKARLERQIEELSQLNRDLESAVVQAQTESRRLQSELSAAQGLRASDSARLAELASGVSSAHQLTDSLLSEVRAQRTQLLAIEREKVELDEALRDVNGQLEVAVQARRALEEELQRKKDELAGALTQLSHAIADGFNPNADVRSGGMQDGVAPDKNLDATIISVSRGADHVLAEIDAGSRDGVKQGWVLTIGRGSQFKGKVRITRVDINRATGIVTLEDPFQGPSRLVEVGDTAYARVGRN